MANTHRFEDIKRSRLASDPEYYRTYFRDRYQRLRHKIREQQASYYKANAEALRDQALVWSKSNPEKVRAKLVEWRRENIDKYKVHVQRRRTRKAQSEGSHTAADLMSIMGRQGGKCPWCKKDIRTSYHVDHVVPLSRGGRNDPGNLALLCSSCNTSKGNKNADEFGAWLLRSR